MKLTTRLNLIPTLEMRRILLTFPVYDFLARRELSRVCTHTHSVAMKLPE
jgi:hypothetical protein